MAHVPVEGKSWGQTRVIYRDQVSEVCHASIVAGGYSSRHHHRHKDNTFYVLRGVLVVTSYVNREGDVLQAQTLTAGESCTVERGVWHAFEATTAVELIETYSIGLHQHDIERADLGGIR